MKVGIKGGNPGRITYSWDVEWADGSSNADLAALKAKLATEKGSKIKVLSVDSGTYDKKFQVCMEIILLEARSSEMIKNLIVIMIS